jgi:thioredoxin reductase (NADPH)
MQSRVFNDPKIEVVWNTQAIEALGESKLTGVRVQNDVTNAETIIPASGLFYAIGTLFLPFFILSPSQDSIL